MRLSKYEQDIIKILFKEIFKFGEIYIFGSRVDDSKKGGDIDIFIDCGKARGLTKMKIDFLVALKREIGEQKIDVVISRDKNRPIEKIALQTGVQL